MLYFQTNQTLPQYFQGFWLLFAPKTQDSSEILEICTLYSAVKTSATLNPQNERITKSQYLFLEI
jgi:hypothetical protein